MSHTDHASPELWVCHAGSLPYREALAVQSQIATRRRARELPDTLLLLEHPPVYTRGRRSRPGELTLGEDPSRARDIEVVPTDRGGRLTYHGPGQLVGYPIMGVTDVVAHLRTIENAIVAALAEEGIAAHSRPQDGPDYTGVWVGDRKIASLGVHVSRGISTHGFAVNVDNDLEPFTWVVACGLPDVEMTSIAAELPRPDAELPRPDAELPRPDAELARPDAELARPDGELARPAGELARPDGELARPAGEPARSSKQARPGSERALSDPKAPCARTTLDCFRKRVAHHFCEAHGRRQRLVTPQRLGIAAPVAAPLPREAVPA